MRYKLSNKRKDDSISFLKKLLKSKIISKEEKTEIKKLIIIKQKRNSKLSEKIIHSKTAELAYTLLGNLGAGVCIKIGSMEFINYNAEELLLIMGKIVRTANDKKVQI